LPEEAQMHPQVKPRPPAPALFITLAASHIPDRWHPYLGPFSSSSAPAYAAAVA
jgi:hypothetical protein